ncbi:MAG: hypothetical protein WB998_06140 [Solirubrobacteraceae bacterium]
MGEEEQEVQRTGYDRIGRIAVYLGVIAGGWLFATRVVEPPSEHHPARVAAVVVAAGLLAFGVYRWQEWSAERHRRQWLEESRVEAHADEPKFEPNRAWVPPLIVFGVIVAFVGWQGGSEIRNHEITYYCSYGAVSRAQLVECESNVSSDYIRSLDTNAARFAEGQLESCLQDAGPYCAATKADKELEEEAPRPGE